MNRSTSLAAALLAAMVFAPAAQAADLVLISGDTGTGLGLDDPTPKAPEGFNPGATLGAQRTIAYQFAMDLWGSVLQSDATVYVGASFQPLACTPTSATLGSAGTTFVFSDFAPGIVADTWYPSALADAIAGGDLNPGFIDINSRFNGDIGVNPNCLTGADWYYGLDGKTPAGKINFLNVVMHELGHGLGFQGFTGSSGAFFSGRQDIYSTFAYDNVLARTFPAMTPTERANALRSTGQLVWSGTQVKRELPLVLDHLNVLKVLLPWQINGGYEVGLAGFGPAPSIRNLLGFVVAAQDAGGVSATDACEPIGNAALVRKRIALVDRGNCPYLTKAANVQAAGAIGMVVANTGLGAPAMGGVDPAITIPSVSLSQADGAQLRAHLPALVTFGQDRRRYQGADGQGRARLYAPNPYEPGSSFSHYDVSHAPNALMEPAITSTLRGDANVDLTPALFTDIGWTLNPERARIGACDTRVDVVEEGGLIPGANVQAWDRLCQASSSARPQYLQCMDGYRRRAQADGFLRVGQGLRVLACAAALP
jgi:hypothetical protein